MDTDLVYSKINISVFCLMVKILSKIKFYYEKAP